MSKSFGLTALVLCGVLIGGCASAPPPDAKTTAAEPPQCAPSLGSNVCRRGSSTTGAGPSVVISGEALRKGSGQILDEPVNSGAQ